MAELNNINGKVMKFGESINTDVIIPSKYLELRNPSLFSKYVMEPIRASAYQDIEQLGQNIIVADKDFGCGSSREQAPEALKSAGIKAIVAESFATIFYRNAINVGLPVIEVHGISNFVNEGDHISIDFDSAEIRNLTQSTSMTGEKTNPFLLDKLRVGGLIPELQEFVRRMESGDS